MGHLERVDPPEVQADASLLLHGLDVPEEVLVASGQDAEHSKVGGLQPRPQVAGDVVALLGDVVGDDDVLDAELATHPADVAPPQVGDHAPVVGVGNRAHLELVDDEVQCVGAVTTAREGHDALVAR